MLIAVISDTHDTYRYFRDAVNEANSERCDYLLHLGDVTRPRSAEVLKKFNGLVHGIFGNCDVDHHRLVQVFNSFGGSIDYPPHHVEIDNKSFILQHSPMGMENIIENYSPDYFLYGHTHRAYSGMYNNTKVLNPGELSNRFGSPGFHIIDTSNGTMREILF